MPKDYLQLETRSIDDLLEMRASMKHWGYESLVRSITDELNARGYVDMPRQALSACSCFTYCGDNKACAIHGGNHATK